MKPTSTKQRVQLIKGVSYVYEDSPYWDPIKKQTRHKRRYIGKLDQNGHFIPNSTFAAASELQAIQKHPGRKRLPLKRCFYGATSLLHHLSQQLGILKDLEEAFPEEAYAILSLAYYLVMENDSPMYRFSHWAIRHWHPYNRDLSSQRISDLFAHIQNTACQHFFRNQHQRRMEKEHLAYDTTSISSYSQLINQVKYGYNKDGDSLPQINLALVFGEESMLPVYYRKLPGNITDVSTVQKLLRDLDTLGYKKIKLVMDRGFFSTANLNGLYQRRAKFLITGKSHVRWIRDHIEKVRSSIQHFTCYEEDHELYRSSTKDVWPYEERNAQGEILRQSTRRIYVHVYYNGHRAEEEKQDFLHTLHDLKTSLEEGECAPHQEEMRDRFFNYKETPKRGRKIGYKEEAIEDHLKTFGYFVLLSNEIKDPLTALSLYRNKDLVEKAFGNLKNRLNMRRFLVSSGESLDGKLFVQFVALILVSAIHQVMKKHKLYRRYSMASLLDDLDLIERFDAPGRPSHLSEITQRQKDLYACFGVKPLNML